ncbi:MULTISPECIES: hypothetical protein [unclassified Rhodococcus (in: high G+C Gram-positive bacteria)]|uniref:hypothetical protein n=1 Tax=unclassified Rhodococcus (in: high G+C Gram-positive bacteria) TaxID=192944 RepID=UPI0034E895EA
MPVPIRPPRATAAIAAGCTCRGRAVSTPSGSTGIARSAAVSPCLSSKSFINLLPICGHASAETGTVVGAKTEVRLRRAPPPLHTEVRSHHGTPRCGTAEGTGPS